METAPNKEIFNATYSNFLNYADFDKNILEIFKKDEGLKTVALFHLKERLYEQENPELLNEKYIEINGKTMEGVYSLRNINNISRELVDEFLEEQNISNPTLIRNLNVMGLENFLEKILIFFDRRLSPTLLGLAEDDFPFLKDKLPIARENIIKTIDAIASGGFESLTKNEEKIQILKKRIGLIENL